MKKLILIPALLLFNTALAKNLECDDAPSYTGRSFSINRDGAIGFNGTYIVAKAQSGWGFGKHMSIHLDEITGRPNDAKFRVNQIVLAISPKNACTNPNAADPLTPFKCSAQDVTVIAQGVALQESNNGKQPIFDTVTVESQLQGAVDAELAQGASNTMYLQVKLNTTGKDVSFEIPVRDNKTYCSVK